MNKSSSFSPDYAVSPGKVLEEHLQTYKLTKEEFALKCGLPLEVIRNILDGEEPVELDTALKFQKVLGIDAGIWLNIERAYQEHKEKRK